MSWNEIKSRFLAFKSSALKSNAPTLIKFVSDSTIVFTAGNPSRLFSKDLETGIQIDLTPTLETNLNKTSLEEELIKERMRVVATGITDFTVTDSHILFSFGSNLYSGIIDNIKMIPIEISDPLIDYKLSPDLINVSFIKDRDLYTAEINTGIVTRHTFSDRPTLMNGVASYIIQEEFSRYTGYWWNPAGSRILYEIVDEKYVDVFSISRHSSVETYRYPQVGRNNAIVDIAIVEINGSITKRLYGKQNSLKVLFPWIEYITRLGWIDNNHIFVQVIDRRQTAGAILKISIDAFHSESNLENINLGQGITILFEETSSIWLNIVDIHYFLPDGRLIVSSERTGYRHLYIMSFKANSLNGDVFSTSQISINQLTGGSWCIIDSPISVDESKFLVYFTAKKDTVLENHLYVTSYESNILEIVHEPKSQVGHIIGVDCTFKNDAKVGSVIQADFDFDFKIHRLTNLGFFHKISLNPTCTRFCSVFSNTATLLTCESFEIGFNGEDYTAASTSKVYCPVDSSVVTPKFSSFVNHDGIEINIMTFYPPNFDPSKKYPTILYVYGGPHVQLVTNENKSSRYSNLIFGLELGYAVVIVDGRGSCNRGLMFEGWIKHRMGTVELFDQIDALIFMSRGRCIGKFETVDQAWADLKGQGGWIDTERVVVTGWSYGGYLSLMALCQYPNVFKASIPGAPVTDWLLYDTGYTERYMGLIDENKNGYEKGNVMHYSDGFPCRDALLLVHGMTDENVHFRHTESLVLDLVKKQIPHRIQPFPGERHGLRGKEASAYFEVLKYSFLQDLMKNS